MNNHHKKEDYINLKKIFDYLLSKWLYFVISMILTLTIGFIYLKVTPKEYRAKASIQLKDESLIQKGNGREKFISGLELLASNSEIEDEIGILSSYNMVEKTIAQLKFNIAYYEKINFVGLTKKKELYNKSPFIIEMDYDQPQIINVPVFINFPEKDKYRVTINGEANKLFDFANQELFSENFDISTEKTLDISDPFFSDFLSFRITLNEKYNYKKDVNYYFIITTDEQLTKRYHHKLTVSQISQESNIVNLATEGIVPQKEIDFLNKLTEVYIQSDIQEKSQLGFNTINFLDNQIRLISDSLANIEERLKEFRATSQIVNIPSTSDNLNNTLNELEEQRALIDVQLEYLNYSLNKIENEQDVIEVVSPSSIGIDDPFFNNLLVQLSELQKEKIEKSISSSLENPVSKVIDEKIQSTRKYLVKKINGLLNSKIIALKEKNNRIDSIRSVVKRIPQNELDLTNIERKFKFNENIYNYLLQKRTEAGLALASNFEEKKIIDTARLASEKPINPDTLLVFGMSFVLGLLFPIGIFVASEFLNNKVNDKGDIENITGFNVIGTITNLKNVPQKYLDYTNGSTHNEVFRFLIVNLERLYNFKINKVIGFTSPEPGDGKTFCAYNTAMTFAKLGKKTIYIDADIRKKKKLNGYFTDIPNSVQISENEINWEKLIKESNTKNLSYLPISKIPNNPELLLFQKPELDNLFYYLRKDFEVIIIDTPPMTIISDYFALSKYFDIDLIVVRYKKTSRKLLEEVSHLNKLKPLNNPHVIFNDVHFNQIKYYYA